MIGGERIKLSEQFCSAPSRNYAPLWYICHDWGWGNKLSDDFYSALLKIIPHYSIVVMIGGERIKLSEQFCSAPSRNYAPWWYICHDWWWGL